MDSNGQVKLEMAALAEEENEEGIQEDIDPLLPRTARYKLGQDNRSVYAFGSSKPASLQHVDNLSTIIQEGLRQQQLSRVAGASSKLITYLAQAIHPVRKYRLSETQRIMRHLHAVEAGLECLQHPPKPFVGENLVRLLRQVQALQVAPGQKVSLQLEQAFAVMFAGNLSDAYDTLAEVLTGAPDPGSQFLAESFCGLIRHLQWASAIQTASAQLQTKPEPGSSNMGVTTHGGMSWVAYDPTVVAAAGRSASEYWKDAEKHLKSALALQPSATHLAYTLAQMYCALGRQPQALEMAGQLCRSVPEEADAHALHLLLLEAQGISGQEEAARASEACCRLLRCDPGAHSAAKLLVRLAPRRLAAPAALADALMLHLEVCSVVDQLEQGGQPEQTGGETEAEPLDYGVATCAAVTWVAVADIVTQSSRQALAAVEQHSVAGSAAAPGAQHGEHTAAGDRTPQTGASALGRDWMDLQEVLRERAWWWGKHTLKTALVQRLCSAGLHQALAAMAVVAAFVMSSNGSTFCEEAVSALEAARAEQECRQVAEASQLCHDLAQHQADGSHRHALGVISRKRPRIDSQTP